MTPTQIALVQDSFADLSAAGPAFAQTFHARLFQLDASLRSVFQGDSGAPRDRLMRMLRVAVRHLGEPELLAAALRKIGERHRGHGMRRYDFDTFAQTLDDCLRARLGERFDAVLQAAWRDAFELIAREMRSPAR